MFPLTLMIKLIFRIRHPTVNPIATLIDAPIMTLRRIRKTHNKSQTGAKFHQKPKRYREQTRYRRYMGSKGHSNQLTNFSHSKAI